MKAYVIAAAALVAAVITLSGAVGAAVDHFRLGSRMDAEMAVVNEEIASIRKYLTCDECVQACLQTGGTNCRQYCKDVGSC